MQTSTKHKDYAFNSSLLAFLLFRAVFSTSVALHQIFIFLLHFSRETLTSFISSTHSQNFLNPTLLIRTFSSCMDGLVAGEVPVGLLDTTEVPLCKALNS